MQGIFNTMGIAYPSFWNGLYATDDSETSLDHLTRTGANTISIVPTQYVSNITSADFQATARTESMANLKNAIEDAQARGLAVLLKPHVDSLDGQWRADMAPADIDAWFAGYKSMIIDYARLAADTGVSMFSIGCELKSLTGAAYKDHWTDIISAVRAVYAGPLTYAATALEISSVSFWEQLDVVGVNPYIPLSKSTTPTTEALVHAWTHVPVDHQLAGQLDYRSPVDFLRDFAWRLDKPLLMTEIGYRSLDGAALNPGTWKNTGTADQAEQATLYEAFFRVWADHAGDWLIGAHLWNWEPRSNPIGEETGYTPQNKLAESVIARWYGSPPQGAGLTIYGSPTIDRIEGGFNHDTLQGGLGNDTIKGGAGDDIILGGPDSITRLEHSSITIEAMGSLLNGIGAYMQLRVDGTQVGAPVEVRPATTTMDVQKFTFDLINPANGVGRLEIAFVNDARSATEDRNLYIQSVIVNGHNLTVEEGVNSSVPGTWSLWSNGTVAFDLFHHGDLIYGAASDDDVLEGGSGNDVLDGGSGNDILIGGPGNDVFTIHHGQGSDVITDFLADPGDAIHFEGFDFTSFAAVLARMTQSGPDMILDLGGADTLRFQDMTLDRFSPTSIILSGVTGFEPERDVQPPTLLESAQPTYQITGGPHADLLNGTSGPDKLNGRAGGDTMTGRGSDDTYVVDGLRDTVIERQDEGTDTVLSMTAKLVLPAYVENLTLNASAAVTGIGNELANVLKGNSGANTLDGAGGDDILIGGGGADVLTGGPGRDLFVFRTLDERGDSINDFTPGQDWLDLRDVVRSVGYTGDHPVEDGYLRFVGSGVGTEVHLDPDSLGGNLDIVLVTFKGLAMTGLQYGPSLFFA